MLVFGVLGGWGGVSKVLPDWEVHKTHPLLWSFRLNLAELQVDDLLPSLGNPGSATDYYRGGPQ